MAHRYTRLLTLLALFITTALSGSLAQSTHAASAAATLYVAPGAICGNAPPCYGTIQEAVDAAQAGDTVKVAAGTYTGAGVQVVYISKSLALAGGFSTLNWSKADPQTNATTIDAQNQVGRRGIVVEGADPVKFLNVSINGFTVRNGNNAPPQGCGGICVANTVADIRSNTVLSNTGGGIYVLGGASLGPDVNVSTVAQNVVQYSRLDLFDKGGVGIVIEGSNAVVVGNTMSLNHGWGLWTFRGSNSRILNNVIRDNDGNGIVSSTSRTLLIDGNTVSNNGQRGMTFQIVPPNQPGEPPYAVYDTVLTVTNNTVQNNTQAGLFLLQSSPITGTIATNTLSGNGAYGVFSALEIGSALTFTQNTIISNKLGGVSLDAYKLTSSALLSNTIQNNVGSGIILNGTATGVAIVRGNSIQSNIVTNPGITDGGGGIRVESGTVRIERNRITLNSVNGYGGGVFINNTSSTLNLTHVDMNANLILTNTSKGLGAGIAIGGGVVTATNDIIARNYADLPAVYVFGGTLVAKHWTLANNGSYAMRVFYGGVATVINSIVAGHKVAGLEQSLGGALNADHILSWNNGQPCQNGAICTNIIVGDPKFLSDRAINYHITAGSAAIDQAVASGVTDDIDGPGRPQGSAPDLGADEYGNFTPTLVEVFLPVTLR